MFNKKNEPTGIDKNNGKGNNVLAVNGKLYRSWKEPVMNNINPLNAELNPICHLLALLGGATIVVVSRLRVKAFF